VRHPFERLSDDFVRRALLVGVPASCILGAVLLAVLGRGPGLGALTSLVVAGTPERAAEVVAGWTPADRIRVAFAGGFDLLFGVTWANTMALGSIWSARRVAHQMLAALAAPLAWLLWIAMALDVPENAGYVRMLLGPTYAPWPQVTAAAVVGRALICGAALLHIAACLALAMRAGRAPAVDGEAPDG
jgi:hypothetical protein